MSRRSERGVALVMVLGIIALLSAVVIGIKAEIRRDLDAVRGLGGVHAARRMAETGFAAALILLQYDYEEDSRNRSLIDYYYTLEEGIDSLARLARARELWSLFRPGADSPMATLGFANHFLPLGTDGGVELTIVDQSGLWNVHRLLRGRGVKLDDPEAKGVLHGLTDILDDAERARTVLASLIDWLDTDDERVDPLGAEQFYYGALDPPYEPRNGPMSHREELRALRGVDEAVYAKLVSAITVWPNDLGLYSAYKVNLNTAPLETLLLLDEGMDREIASRIVEAREEEPFGSVGAIQRFFVDELGLKKLWSRLLERDIVTVRSRTFYVHVVGYAGDQRAILEGVIDRDPKDGRLRVVMQRWITLT